MELTCNHCSSTSEPRIKESGPHLSAYCGNCGRYIKHIRQQPEDDFTLFFGKYKGRNVKSMLTTKEERDYLLWLYDKATSLKANQRTIIANLIHV